MTTAKAGSQQSEAAENEVTTQNLMNQEVYSRTGKRVGRVKDIVVDFETQRIDGLLVTDVNRNLFSQDSLPKEFVIPYEWVQDAESIVITVPVSSGRVNFR